MDDLPIEDLHKQSTQIARNVPKARNNLHDEKDKAQYGRRSRLSTTSFRLLHPDHRRCNTFDARELPAQDPKPITGDSMQCNKRPEPHATRRAPNSCLCSCLSFRSQVDTLDYIQRLVHLCACGRMLRVKAQGAVHSDPEKRRAHVRAPCVGTIKMW